MYTRAYNYLRVHVREFVHAAGDTGVSPELSVVSNATSTGGSVLEAIDQVLRQERRRWPATSPGPMTNDSMGLMHPPAGMLGSAGVGLMGGGGLMQCGTSAEDRSMALIASTFPDSPISSEEEDEEPPAMPLLPDMPRRRRLHHMMPQVIDDIDAHRENRSS